VPSPKWRRLGHKGQDLKDSAGRWMDRQAAAATAEALNLSLSEGAHAHGRPGKPAVRTCGNLIDTYLESLEFSQLSPRTREGYRSNLRIWRDAMGTEPLAAISKPIMHGYYRELFNTRGHSSANAVLRVVQLVFSYAEIIGLREAGSNPCASIKKVRLPPRLVMLSRQEWDHLTETADTMSLPGVGTAVSIAVYSGQRRGDIFAMTFATFRDHEIDLRQLKRGALVNCPLVRQCKDRIERERARLIAAGRLPAGPVIVNPETGNRYSPTAWRRHFNAVRAEAAKTMPSLAEKQFKDLRSTAVSNLAYAGCSVLEISAISGHDPRTAHELVKHYLVMDKRLSRSAIEKYQSWLDQPENLDVA
jgi:integrase